MSKLTQFILTVLSALIAGLFVDKHPILATILFTLCGLSLILLFYRSLDDI